MAVIHEFLLAGGKEAFAEKQQLKRRSTGTFVD